MNCCYLTVWVLLEQDHVVPMDQDFFVKVAKDAFDFMSAMAGDAARFQT